MEHKISILLYENTAKRSLSKTIVKVENIILPNDFEQYSRLYKKMNIFLLKTRLRQD